MAGTGFRCCEAVPGQLFIDGHETIEKYVLVERLEGEATSGESERFGVIPIADNF